MHVTLTARKQRVYSKLVFKTYKKALCNNWLRKLSERNVEFHLKHNALTHNRRRFGQQHAAVVELNGVASIGGDGLGLAASAPIG